MAHLYLNNKLVNDKKAQISIWDHGVLYGDGVYETIRVYRGFPFQLLEHLQRLKKSVRGINISYPWTHEKLIRIVNQVIQKNRHSEARVRIMVTRGTGPMGFGPIKNQKPTLVVSSHPFKPYPRRWIQRGIRVAVVNTRRVPPECIPPWVKSNNCLNGILARKEAAQVRAQEAIYLSVRGRVAEGSVSNIFVIKKGILKTPVLDGQILAGVTRDYLIKKTREWGHRVQQVNLRLKDLIEADEILVTNTTMEIMPVGELVVLSGRKRKTYKMKSIHQTQALRRRFAIHRDVLLETH